MLSCSLGLLDLTPVESLLSNGEWSLDLMHHDDSKVEECQEEKHEEDSCEGVWLDIVSNVHIVKLVALGCCCCFLISSIGNAEEGCD